MAQLLVRNIDETVKTRLKRRAKRHGRSMEQEVREILRDATRNEPSVRTRKLGTEIADLFRGVGLKEDIPEMRGFPVEPIDFDE